MQNLTEAETKLFYTSVSMVALTLVAFVLFAIGITIGFYLFAVFAIIAGLSLAYGLSKEGKAQQASPARKKKGSR